MTVEKQHDIIVSNDWTRNWQASIAVKITAITLWPTIFVVFLAAYFLLYDLDEQVGQEQHHISITIAYHASSLWSLDNALTFHEKVEQLRNEYRELGLPGFLLLNQGQTFRIGDIKVQSSYYDRQLHTQTDIESPITIRTYFPDIQEAVVTLRNKIIASILFAVVLFCVFLSIATHIILSKPLQGLVHATKKISEGHQQVRVDTTRKDEFGTLAQFFNNMVDNLIQQKNLEYEAKTDFLTGLANRRHFDETIKYELRRSARINSPLTLIMCDVDYFKQYNDLYNHVAGDLCLKHIARAMESVCSRAGDLVARYGGEEFVFILPNTDRESGVKVAHMIKQEIAKLKIPHSHSTESPYVTLSMGVATLIDSGVTLSATNLLEKSLIESADQALYLAKHNGRNRIEVVDVKPVDDVAEVDLDKPEQKNAVS